MLFNIDTNARVIILVVSRLVYHVKQLVDVRWAVVVVHVVLTRLVIHQFFHSLAIRRVINAKQQTASVCWVRQVVLVRVALVWRLQRNVESTYDASTMYVASMKALMQCNNNNHAK